MNCDSKLAIASLCRSDPKLAKWINKAPLFAIELRSSSLFVSLAKSIVFQQLHGKAAETIFSRLCAVFPRGLNPRQLAQVSDEALRGAGLSQNKLLALRDLAQKILDKEIPTLSKIRGMDDEAIIKQLTTVRGIGRWTVQMLLMFHLGRPDVLPIDDYGVRKGFGLIHRKKELPTPKELLAHGERWRPYRSVASWYCWRAVDMRES